MSNNLRKLPQKRILQVRIDLEETEPLVWRRLYVYDNLSFWQFHEILQVTMGWMHSHLCLFHVDDLYIGRPDWDDSGDDDWEDARKMKIRKYLSEPGDDVRYEYDLGDGWMHRITLEKVVDESEAPYRLPRCVDGANACPPEDCGGTYGFQHLKEVIADPEDEEHEEMLTWLDGYYPNYDPQEFSLSSVNKILNLGASKYLKVIAKLYR